MGAEQVGPGWLARLGFTDPERARRLLDGPELVWLAEDAHVLRAIAAAPDPDLALTGLDRLTSSLAATTATADTSPVGGLRAALRAALRDDGRLRERLLAVLGFSVALSDHLARHPADWRILERTEASGRESENSGERGASAGVRQAPETAISGAAGTGPDGVGRGAGTGRSELFRAVGADPDVPAPRANGAGGEVRDALRVAYRRHLLAIAADDLTGAVPVECTTTRLARLAGAALDAALAVARTEIAGASGSVDSCRLAIIGMGKCGGEELNYASDVDVVFVAEPAAGAHEHEAPRVGARLAAATVRACSEATPEGALWPVDTALRPEGKNGPLVRTLASHLAYYERWASTWEFQALLKARPVAGDRALGQEYVDAVAPMVWHAADRRGFVDDVQAMRRRVTGNVRPEERPRQLKLAPGGLRDVEFACQLLQLVHGRADDALRQRGTLAALEALSAGGYVGRDDAASLAEAYRFLRSLEHLVQLGRLRRTHVVPDDEADRRRIGRAMGFRVDPVGELTAAWERHSREVRRLHEKLFYRPLLRAVARLPGDETRLTPEAGRARLEALGYADPAGALRHLEALTAGVSRRAAIQRTLLPVLLGWFADSADPDAGLLRFRRVSEALGATPWYLRLLRDGGAAAERLARLLASSRYATDLLLRAPEAVSMLADERELAPRTLSSLRDEMVAAARRHQDPEHAVAVVRALRRRELLRVAAADLLGFLDVVGVGDALADIAAATLDAGLEAARRSVGDRWAERPPARLAVIGMGGLGGHEMGYGSDADVLFVYEPPAEDSADAAGRAARAAAEELGRLLGQPGAELPLRVDTGLRPEGRNGPLARTLESYGAYYARWGEPWERQALLRARPVAGDAELGRRFVALIDPLRYPEGGIDPAALREVRRIKARMEAERLPRGRDPSLHTKLGRGGLADVEWTAQLTQLRHAAEVPELRTTRTLTALDVAAGEGLLDRTDADTLAAAWRAATRVRGAVMLVRGRPADVVPTEARERAGVGHVLGYELDRAGEMLEDYRRLARRARAVMRRVFFGE